MKSLHRATRLSRRRPDRVAAMTAPTPARRLAVFRAWFVTLAALTLYLVWAVVVEYRVHAHDPGFVLPNVGVLLAWWGVFVRTWVAWQRAAGGA